MEGGSGRHSGGRKNKRDDGGWGFLLALDCGGWMTLL